MTLHEECDKIKSITRMKVECAHMVFSSLFFLYAFFPLNLLCYALAKDIKSKNIVMMVFSLVFYAWGEPVYVALLVGMALADWGLAQYIGRQETKSSKARLGLVLACLVNLALLGVFKYGTFFLANTKALFGVPEVIPQIALPIGISFYTFQLLSYVVDVYRGEVKAQKSFATLLLYVSLFHQCIAGPIVRYQDVENELMYRQTSLKEIYAGISRFTIGLAKKAVLANACGALADTLLISDSAAAGPDAAALLSSRPALALWIGMLAYMLQIYLDFSAYSDMAIGMGRMIGFHYRENFDYPYQAASVTDFWRRWHMSLSYFFRDYVYIPLGGNRKGKGRTIFNLFVVWLLTGFWHGASWNFVLWGLYYFVFLVMERTFLKRQMEKWPAFCTHLYLLAVVYFGWILFKFRDLSLVGITLKGMFGFGGAGFTSFEVTSQVLGHVWILLISVVGCTMAVSLGGRLLRSLSAQSQAASIVYRVVRVAAPVVLLLLSTVVLVGNSYNPFLYFQF